MSSSHELLGATRTSSALLERLAVQAAVSWFEALDSEGAHPLVSCSRCSAALLAEKRLRFGTSCPSLDTLPNAETTKDPRDSDGSRAASPWPDHN